MGINSTLLLATLLLLLATTQSFSYEGGILKLPGEGERGEERDQVGGGEHGRKNYHLHGQKRFYDKKKLGGQYCVTKCQDIRDVCMDGCRLSGESYRGCRIGHVLCLLSCR